MGKEKIIYDGDPGHDDAMAIIMAEGNPGIELLGITTVAGNSTLENVTKNALRLKDLMHSEVPVAAGFGRPLVKELYTAPFVHGESGLYGPELFEPKSKTIDKHACEFIIEQVMKEPGEISIVTAGPLTNIAGALRMEPGIEEKIKQIVIMGGGRFGNITPAAEFNIWQDAEAAKIVFDSRIKKVMCGLDLTYQALETKEIMGRIGKIDTELGRFANDFLAFYNKTTAGRTKKGASINDACCVAYLIDPSVFETKLMRVDVETKGEFTYGMTCIDVFRMNSGRELKEPNVYVGSNLDFEKFWDLMIGAIEVFK